ncbi:MAG: SDR family oxidoreductase [Bacilli bacterium]|nr:SDR family oxidoreductase [Bacilli bacterium]
MKPVVMVTGSRRGLGKAIAYEFAKKGYNIVLNDKEERKVLEALKADLEFRFAIEVLICFGDVSNESVVLEMLENVKQKFRTLDCLVNNAGIVFDMELFERSTELFETTIHNNVTGTYLMCKHFGDFMFNQDKVTRIINISSTNGIHCNFPTSIDYDASKSAIISLTHNFAIQFAPKVLVNSVAPGWMNTEMNADLPKDLVEEEQNKIYVRRFAEPEEVATLVYYLGSKENTYVNNEVIVIDGGY